MDSLVISHSETIGSELHLRYAKGVNVTVGRVTRDSSKSPQAAIVIDVIPDSRQGCRNVSFGAVSGCYRAQESRDIRSELPRT